MIVASLNSPNLTDDTNSNLLLSARIKTSFDRDIAFSFKIASLSSGVLNPLLIPIPFVPKKPLVKLYLFKLRIASSPTTASVVCFNIPPSKNVVIPFAARIFAWLMPFVTTVTLLSVIISAKISVVVPASIKTKSSFLTIYSSYFLLHNFIFTVQTNINF